MESLFNSPIDLFLGSEGLCCGPNGLELGED